MSIGHLVAEAKAAQAVIASTVTGSVKRFLCIVSRRGKAAKGTVAVELFGRPKKNVNRKTGVVSPVTKKWSYVHAATVKRNELIDSIHKLGLDVNEALMRGADLMLKSSNIRGQNEAAILGAKIFAEGLSQDKESGIRLAAEWIRNIAFMVKMRIPTIPTYDELMEIRREEVAELKKQGLFKLVSRLVAKPKEAEESTEESTDTSSDEDSDDSEDDDISDDDDDSDDEDSDSDDSSETEDEDLV